MLAEYDIHCSIYWSRPNLSRQGIKHPSYKYDPMQYKLIFHVRGSLSASLGWSLNRIINSHLEDVPMSEIGNIFPTTICQGFHIKILICGSLESIYITYATHSLTE